MDRQPSTFRIESPCALESVAALRAGDRVLLSGILVTARDLAHMRLVRDRPDEVREILRGAFIYHCGPVVVRDGLRWRAVSAGPTTSLREEPYESAVIREYGIAGVIGKGGMGASTASALASTGTVYLHATGGTGAALAAAVTEVVGVHFLAEFGVPEAMWVFRVRDFPTVVTMDSVGGDVHRQVLDLSRAVIER